MLAFDLGLEDSRFINFACWNSLKKRLLSVDKLQYDRARPRSAAV